MSNTWWTNPADLDEQQKAVVSLGRDGHHLVVGPPGCGKTNLLLLRASYLHRGGLKNIAVLTFARSLREFLASGSANYAFSADKIQTYVRWGSTVLRENGIAPPKEEDFGATRSEIILSLGRIAARKRPENLFDCILIDEAQDYTAEELKILMHFTPRLFAVGDKNQRIQSEDESALDSLAGEGFNVTSLKFHYRNGLKVCRMADGILGLVDNPEGLEATSNYDEDTFPSTVSCDGGLSLEDQVSLLIERIPDQLSAYPDEYIGVICPRKQELDIVAQRLLGSGLASSVHVQHGDYEPLSLDRRVVLTTVHGAKGLEFRAGHFVAAETVKKFQLQKKLAYTAVTRCKTSLCVYHDGDLPGYLENGLQACSGPAKEPKLDELFGPGAI
ncbi:AAA family ATPase [Tabrizicola sp.]|uniref:AAA family ATPase n=1 Tax=Tabrizicola sp. TaxID=2005166 RepID=UPI002735398D|nr:AAA family ATPase [Tabrizicola sp.]MDP3194335.1 AAA family ATPase [Tabrizicola sp.]